MHLIHRPRLLRRAQYKISHGINRCGKGARELLGQLNKNVLEISSSATAQPVTELPNTDSNRITELHAIKLSKIAASFVEVGIIEIPASQSSCSLVPRPQVITTSHQDEHPKSIQPPVQSDYFSYTDSEEAPSLSPSGSTSSSDSDVLKRERRMLVNRTMSEFEALFDNMNIGMRERPAGPRSRGNPPHQNRQARSRRAAGQGGNRPDDGAESPDGDGSGRADNPERGLEAQSSVTAKRLACPYYQRDPRKALKNRSCEGPGWPSIHRVKEHLYRVHALPIFCQRCGDEFNTAAELTAHTRLAQACPVQTFDLPDGFTLEQEKILKRKSKPSNSSEEKWREIYRILFPEDDEQDIPSPHYPVDEAQTREQQSKSVERFMRRELPMAVRRHLEQAAEKLHDLDELSQLSGRLVDIVRVAQTELFQQYHATGQRQVPLNNEDEGGQDVGDEDMGMGVDLSPIEPAVSDSVHYQQPQEEFHIDMGTGIHWNPANQLAAFYSSKQPLVDDDSVFLSALSGDLSMPMGVDWARRNQAMVVVADSDSGYYDCSNQVSPFSSGKRWMEPPSGSKEEGPIWAQP